MSSLATKLCISSFLNGLVFWYGFEKLFMLDIVGIAPAGIGIAVAVLQGSNVLLDIPSGVLADRWSRKGVLIIGAIAMMGCSLAMGLANSLALYLVGVVFYSINIVCTSGTADSMLHDELLARGETGLYTKLGGRMASLYTWGYALSSVVGGLLAGLIGYRQVFILTAALAVLNVIIIGTIREPKLHKSTEPKGTVLQNFKASLLASRTVARTAMLRLLVTVMSLLWISEAFKEGFGQLYMLRYLPNLDGFWSTTLLLGILWAVFYMMWAVGELVAHLFDGRITLLIVLTVAPLAVMSVIDNWFVLVLFMVQAIAAAALFIQFNGQILEVTPSNIKTTVMSVKSFIGRGLTVPAIFAMGWIIDRYDVVWALRFATFFAVVALVLWILRRRKAEISEAQSAVMAV